MLRNIFQFITIIIFYLAGNKLSIWLGLPVPGSIVGMVLLFAALLCGVIKLSWIETIGQLHIKHLTLLFIPFTVGVFHYIGIFRMDGVKLMAIIMISSLVVLLVTSSIAEYYDKMKRGKVYENND